MFTNFRSLPKLSSQDDEGPTPQTLHLTGTGHFEPIPHNHQDCERVVINVSQLETFLLQVLQLLEIGSS